MSHERHFVVWFFRFKVVSMFACLFVIDLMFKIDMSEIGVKHSCQLEGGMSVSEG